MKPEEKDLVAKDDAQEQPKKPYATPKLTIHGNVEKITSTMLPDSMVTDSQFDAM